jgi:tetratricopeptide (TPR) repeat protein
MINEAYLQFEPARQCYEQSLNLDEAQPHAWYHLGLMATELGDLASGVAAMRRCIEHEPNYAPAHWRLGLWLIDLARMDEAEQAFRRAMAVNPRDPAGAMGMARVMLERGEAEPAAVLLEALLAANPPNAAYAWQLLATAYRHLGREADAREAAGRGQGADVQWIDDWQYEVVQLRRDKAWRRDLALALAAQGRLPDAILIMEETAVSHPDDLDLLLHLAALLREARRDTQALALLDRVERSASLLLESRPQDAEAREALERARALRGAGAGSP